MKMGSDKDIGGENTSSPDWEKRIVTERKCR